MDRQLLGHVAVDTAMVMVVDPCYVLEGDDYELVCNAMERNNWMGGQFLATGIAGTGVVTPTGLGDGSYPVYAEVEDYGSHIGRRVTRLVVEFMEDDDE